MLCLVLIWRSLHGGDERLHARIRVLGEEVHSANRVQLVLDSCFDLMVLLVGTHLKVFQSTCEISTPSMLVNFLARIDSLTECGVIVHLSFSLSSNKRERLKSVW